MEEYKMQSNANIDFCGVIMLLRALKKAGRLTDNELQRIANRVATQIGADIIISVEQFSDLK